MDYIHDIVIFVLIFMFLQTYPLKNGISKTKVSCNLKEANFTIENYIEKAPTQSNLPGPDSEDADNK